MIWILHSFWARYILYRLLLSGRRKSIKKSWTALPPWGPASLEGESPHSALSLIGLHPLPSVPLLIQT